MRQGLVNENCGQLRHRGRFSPSRGESETARGSERRRASESDRAKASENKREHTSRLDAKTTEEYTDNNLQLKLSGEALENAGKCWEALGGLES